MKTFLLHLAFVVMGTLTTSAQLVHLTLDGTVTSKFEGASWSRGAGTGENEPARLHLYFDPTLPGRMENSWTSDRTFTSNNRANNFWHLQYGAIDVSAPFQTIEVSDTGLSLFSFRVADSSTLDLRLNFSDSFVGYVLPRPPFPKLGTSDVADPNVADFSTFVFDTAGYPGLEEGSIFVGLDHLSGEVTPRFQAVPEPSALGIMSVLMCILMVAWRRPRRGAVRPPMMGRS